MLETGSRKTRSTFSLSPSPIPFLLMMRSLADPVREEISGGSTPSLQGKQWIKALDAYSGNPGKKLKFPFHEGKSVKSTRFGCEMSMWGTEFLQRLRKSIPLVRPRGRSLKRQRVQLVGSARYRGDGTTSVTSEYFLVRAPWEVFISQEVKYSWPERANPATFSLVGEPEDRNAAVGCSRS